MNKIRKLLSVGDTVYPINGKPVKVTGIFANGFVAENNYFTYDEHRQKFYLHEAEWRRQHQ